MQNLRGKPDPHNAAITQGHHGDLRRQATRRHPEGHKMNHILQQVDPIARPINDIVRMTGISRSELYRRLAAGDIRAVKSGRTTLVLMDSVRAHLASLPPAIFRTAA